MKQIIFLMTATIIFILIAACQPKANPALPDNPFITAMNCVEIQSKIGAYVECRPVQTGQLILQTKNPDHVLLQTSGINITFDSTIYVQASPGEVMTIAVLEGSAVASSYGITRIIPTRMQVRISLDEGLHSTSPPEEPENFDFTAARLPLDELSRPLQVPLPKIATPTRIASPVPQNDECAPAPLGWSTQYIVQSGDNLTRIANRFATTVEEIRKYNCLANPNRIGRGDTLLLPANPG